MQIQLPLRVGILALAIVVLLVLGGSLVFADGQADPVYTSMDEALVTLDDDTQLWPYTSRSPSANDRTLGLNLVIYGDIEHTRYILQQQQFRDWQEVDEDREDIAAAEDFDVDFNQTGLSWGQAAGADRWVWVNPADGEPVWLGEAYQLEQGDYLGHRHHIRAYEDPVEGEWTALQAHVEHWDWFHLRHTVHSIEESQLAVEAEFHNRWFVSELTRVHFGNDASSDGDGWVTIIELDEEVLPLLFGALTLTIASFAIAVPRERLSRVATHPHVFIAGRILGVMSAIIVFYFFVRFGAVGLERVFAGANPKLIVAAFYPLLVVGMPTVVYLLARQLDATTAFWAATLAFVVATFIDYTYLGVFRIPLETFVHRAALAIAIGLIAAGASHTSRTPGSITGYVRTGVLLWAVAVAIPLFQFI